MRYMIRIKLESDMCAGNGESRGNAIDRDICTDKYGLPYIPAKRLKGCLRQTAEFLQDNHFALAAEENLKKLFGNPFGEEGNLVIDDAHLSNAKAIRQSILEMTEENTDKAYLKRYTHPENVEKIFTAVRGQTRLREGVKINSTLRFTRVLTKYNAVFNEQKPLEFISYGCISDVSEEQFGLLEACCKGTRHIGTGRNRGLGNVSIMLEEVPAEKSKLEIPDFSLKENEMYQMSYHIVVDSPVTIPGCGELMTLIPAKSVIGCFGGFFMKNQLGADARFQDLFLNGKVKWSALTPVIKGEISVPVPALLMKLKNAGGKLINKFAETDDNWKRLKPKTVEGSFASAITDGSKVSGFYIADVETHAQYHNSVSKTMLYTQDAIREGYIYGGTVCFCGKYYEDIIKILTEAEFRFGRSKNIQYSNCHLSRINAPVKMEHETKIAESKKIFIVLQSDMVISQNGMYVTENKEVRRFLVDKLEGDGMHFADSGREELEISLDMAEQNTDGLQCADSGGEEQRTSVDIVRYGVIGGFQNMWHLQKPQIPVIKAGSVYVFEGKFDRIPDQITVGDMQQEGFGVCKVFTEEEINHIKEVLRADIDKDNAEKLRDKEAGQVIFSLTIQCVRECLLKYAHAFQVSGREVPLGRLRLMLEQAENYDDLLKRINTMKTSDASSESEGKRVASQKLVKEFYGVGSINWRKLLKGEEGLYEAVSANPDMMNKIEKRVWKLPLMELIHTLHYREGQAC